MELQKTQKNYRKLGYKVCAVSYDSAAILSEFARRKSITYPLLSDPGSKLIAAFGILKPAEKAGQKPDGLPYPGTFFIDKHGVVVKKSMEKNYWERKSMRSLLVTDFGAEPASGVQWAHTGGHLKLTVTASQDTVYPGCRFSLAVSVTLGKGVHVYAPEVTGGYKPVKFTLDSSAQYKIKDAEFPKAKTLYLKAIREKVPVYEGRFTIYQDLTLKDEKKLRKAGAGTAITVSGAFEYQACDAKVCYLPEKLDFKLNVPLGQNDWDRIK